MHHPILFGVLGGLILTRLVFRARMRRAWAGGGCGCAYRRGGPIDLGAPDGPPAWARHRGRAFARWSRRWRAEAQPAPAVPVDVAGALELNQRQRELFDELLARARPALSVAALAEALAAVGREPFDRAEVEAVVGNRELVDDLEHLHHSLTPEQRARLRQVTAA